MSTSGLTNQYIPPTLDGLTVVDADQIYIDGQLVDLTTLVPYTGADKPVDVGAQPIRTTYAPVGTNDVVNLQALTDAVAYVDTSVALTYLSKISTVTQSVAGPVSFTNGVQTSTNKDVSLASTVIITPNYPNPTVYDGGVTAGSLFGTITNSAGVYQSTSSGDGGILVLGSGLSSGRVRLMINLLVNDTNGVAVSLFGSSDGVNPYQTIASHTFPPNTTTFWSSDTTFTLSYPYLILICNTASPGLGATVQWYGLTLYQMGVALNNVTLPAQTGDRVVVLDASKRLVSSGINTTKLSYLDNVSSDIQTQINSKASITYVDTGLAGKLNLSGSNANQNINLGSFKVQSNATPTASTDYITKAYGDSTYALTSALSGYVPYTGATADLNMGSRFVLCNSDPSNDNELTRKSYVDTLIATRVPRTGDADLIGDYKTTGSIQANSGIISLAGVRGTAFITSSAVIEYNRVSDRGKWFKIINVGTGPNTYYGEFHITYAVAGEHAHIHFIVSGMYNSAPSIKIIQSSIYGGILVGQLRLSIDNASIYYQGYVEMYLGDYSWYEANVNIYVYGINNAPLNSYYSLISTKTAGTSSGYTYYAVYPATAIDMNYAGKRLYMTDSTFYTNASTTIDTTLTVNSTISTPARIAITNDDPGDLISKRYGGSGDRYGIGQYSQGTVRVFGSNAYGNTSIRFSLATDDVTTGAGAFKDLMTMRYNGVLDIKGGNGGDWAYQYLTRPGGLIIGRIDTNYGGEYQTNNNNVAGFMMECLDSTEIQIHDAGQRLASFMYYSGNNFTIGRDSGYGVTSTLIAGFLNVTNTQQISTGANQNFLTLYANSNNATEYINLRFSHQGNASYIQSYRTSGFWRTYLLFNTVNASGGSVTMFQITDQGIQSYGSFYTAGNAWCGDATTLGNGCSLFSQGWDRWLCYANGYSTAGGYAYYNQGNALGTISDSRIKRDFLRITEEQSVAFLKALEPTSFCLKEQQPFKRKRINEKGEEIEEEVTPAVCSCRQDGWVAQNVLEACEKSGASKSVVNNWYDYQQELLKPEEERKTLIGVSDRPILSHTVNVVKGLMEKVETLQQRNQLLEDHARQQEAKQKEQEERLKKAEERMEKMASLISQLISSK